MNGQQKKLGNYFMVPNAIFHLGLHQTAIAIYAYLMCIEDRRTYQCIASYSTIAKALSTSSNTVAKYVRHLEESDLIRTERTEITTKEGIKRNGCLKYHILPIRRAIELYHERQMEELDRSVVQQRTREKAEQLGIDFVPAAGEQGA